MRIFGIVTVLLLLVVAGYAYFKDPAGCMKLGSDMTADTLAIASTFGKPQNASALQTATPSTTAPTSAGPTATAQSTAPFTQATTSSAVEYPMGYVAKDPASATQPNTVSSPVPQRAVYGSFTDYDQALAAARQANAPMLILFTGSDWCPYCQKLEQEVLSTNDFSTYVSSHFVFLTVDDLRQTPVDDGAKSQVQHLEQKFAVNGFPTLMIVTADQKEVGRQAGYAPGSGPAEVISQLNQMVAK